MLVFRVHSPETHRSRAGSFGTKHWFDDLSQNGWPCPNDDRLVRSDKFGRGDWAIRVENDLTGRECRLFGGWYYSLIHGCTFRYLHHWWPQKSIELAYNKDVLSIFQVEPRNMLVFGKQVIFDPAEHAPAFTFTKDGAVEFSRLSQEAVSGKARLTLGPFCEIIAPQSEKLVDKYQRLINRVLSGRSRD